MAVTSVGAATLTRPSRNLAAPTPPASTATRLTLGLPMRRIVSGTDQYRRHPADAAPIALRYRSTADPGCLATRPERLDQIQSQRRRRPIHRESLGSTLPPQPGRRGRQLTSTLRRRHQYRPRSQRVGCRRVAVHLRRIRRSSQSVSRANRTTEFRVCRSRHGVDPHSSTRDACQHAHRYAHPHLGLLDR